MRFYGECPRCVETAQWSIRSMLLCRRAGRCACHASQVHWAAKAQARRAIVPGPHLVGAVDGVLVLAAEHEHLIWCGCQAGAAPCIHIAWPLAWRLNCSPNSFRDPKRQSRPISPAVAFRAVTPSDQRGAPALLVMQLEPRLAWASVVSGLTVLGAGPQVAGQLLGLGHCEKRTWPAGRCAVPGCLPACP